jgi:ribulose-phosphate 3-epimerase
MKTLVAPSILSADFGRLSDEIRAVETAGADWIHVDVMDGRFVPNITIGPAVVKAVRKATALPIDVHLMIMDPHRYLADFAEAGADHLVIHPEACTHLHRTLQIIRSMGKRSGVAFNPATPMDLLANVIELVDIVLIMSVNPGFGGQKFISTVISKIAQAKKIVDESGLPIHIQVDGGISSAISAKIVESGGDVLVAGSAVFGRPDYRSAIESIRNGGDNC